MPTSREREYYAKGFQDGARWFEQNLPEAKLVPPQVGLIQEGFPIVSDRKTTGSNKRVAEYKINPKDISVNILKEYKSKHNLKSQDGGQLVPKAV